MCWYSTNLSQDILQAEAGQHVVIPSVRSGEHRHLRTAHGGYDLEASGEVEFSVGEIFGCCLFEAVARILPGFADCLTAGCR